MRGSYGGSLFQNIGGGSTVLAEKGRIEIDGRLNTRKNVYLSAAGGILRFGNGCFLNQNVHVVSMESVRIGEGTIVGPNAVIVDHDHDYAAPDFRETFLSSPVEIGRNVWIGANAVILRGTVVGDDSVIAAGAVVKGRFPPGSMVYQERTTRVKAIQRRRGGSPESARPG